MRLCLLLFLLLESSFKFSFSGGALLLGHDCDSFLRLVDKFAICGNTSFNRVVERKDGHNLVLPEFRKWTLQSSAMMRFLGVDASTAPLPLCASLEEALLSAALGTNSLTCIVPWANSTSLCSLLSRYTVVYFNGDSILRHSYQASLMLLKEDLRFGAIARGNEEGFRSCGCDGQFSEYSDCRLGVFSTDFNPSDGLMCTSHTQFSYPWLIHNNESYDKICSESPLLRGVVLNGGPWFKYMSAKFINKFLEPQLKALNHVIDSCEFDIRKLTRLVIIGGTASSRAVIERHGIHQGDENVVRYIREVKAYLKAHLYGVPYIDVFNITREAAEDRSSDGAHFMSDVYSMKAMLIFQTLSAVADVKQTF